MGLGLKNGKILVVILCISELLIVGLLLFSHGFLLTRQVVEKNSTCQDFQEISLKFRKAADSRNTTMKNTSCWMPPTFKKAVILLIDALRYDFATFDETLKEEKPYLNKMPVFEKLIQSKPGKARLLPFIADAPTTTMQRLKGLTTGSLPTFIDASHNFASEEITEDNIIDQLVGCGKKVTMMGDDTWDGLFPGRFNRSFLYPSFNVMDLHTVDNGIISHLDEELARDDWDVIIAHFLGVDHCGHRYGPNHPEMAAKLLQMNDIIAKVGEKTGNDTLLLVFGDHGMTRTGDHGGDSTDEITSALFVYSPSLNMQQLRHPVPVNQVDLIPTLALALGVPIPYSSLGTVIDDILVNVDHTSGAGAVSQELGLALNVHQVDRYLREYRHMGNDFPNDMWERLESIHTKILDGLNDISTGKQKQLYIEYLRLAKMMCEEIWAKFNVSEMGSGLILMINVILLGFVWIFTNIPIDEKASFVNGILLLTVLVNTLFVFSVYISLAVLGYLASFMVSVFLYLHRSKLKTLQFYCNIYDLVPLMIVVFVCLGSTSNSYVILENYVISYLLLSVVTVQVFASFMRQHKKKSIGALPGKLIKWTSNYCGLLCMSSLLVVLACVRICSCFWKCREEQPWCTPSEIHTSMAGLPQGSRNWRYFTSLFSLILLTWLPRRWLLMCGNMNGTKLGVFLTKCVPVICSMFVASHWALQAVPALQNSHLKGYIVMPPLIMYFLVLIACVTLYLMPLMIYEVPPSKEEIANFADNPYTCIPQLYHSLKAKYSSDNTKKPSIPIVYGLATAMSAPLISVMTILLLLIALLAGDGIAPVVLILMIASAAILLVQATSAWMNAEKLENIMKPTWTSICVWFIMSIHAFYATGHHPTFPSIHWSAAFVGFEGNWGTSIIPALLVGFNTFSAHILFGVSLPLVAIAPLALGVVLPKLRGNRLENEDTRQGEFLFVEDPSRIASSLLFTSASYIMLHAGKVFFSAVSAFILRRHLMVWKIFAPHFIFDAVGFIVTCCSVPLGVLFTLRIVKVLDSFSDYLRHKYS